jgi:leucyl-tRNA---protein transferase
MSHLRKPTELLRLVESPRTCSYVETETAQLEYRIFASLTPEELESLVERGWRRFGVQVFRPRCAACTQCVPIRIDVQNYRPSKSQRKTWRRNRHLRVELHRPTVTSEHVELYNAWHRDMTRRRGWRLQQTASEDYAQGFLGKLPFGTQSRSGAVVDPDALQECLNRFPSAHELRYFDGETLIGIGLIDLLPESLSSAYFYHAPEWRPLAPGTFSLMCEIELARQRGLKYLYLGYWIEACPSMSYKNRFDPYELLHGRPEDDETALWQRPVPSIPSR